MGRVGAVLLVLVLAGCGSTVGVGGAAPETSSRGTVATADWVQLPDFTVPGGREIYGGFDAVFDNGRVVIVGGVFNQVQGIGASPTFDLATRTWSELPAPPAQLAFSSPWVWDGHDVLVFDTPNAAGGMPSATAPTAVFALDPASGRWRTLSPSPGWGLRPDSAVWTGSEAIVASNENPSGEGPRITSYSPASDTWSNAPTNLGQAPPGDLMVDAGHPVEFGGSSGLLVGPRQRGTSSSADSPPALWVDDLTKPAPARSVVAPFQPAELVGAGTRVAVLDPSHTQLAFWNPTDGSWTRAADNPFGSRSLWSPRPPGGITHWTGAKLVIWGGNAPTVPVARESGTQAGGPPLAGPPPTPPSQPRPSPDGAEYDPATNSWTPIPAAPITTPVASPLSSIWAGDELFAWSWTGDTFHAAVWTPTQ